MPPYPNNIFMKYGGFERVRKIAASLEKLIRACPVNGPFFENVDPKHHTKHQEQYLKVKIHQLS
jgi:hypothetical protein